MVPSRPFSRPKKSPAVGVPNPFIRPLTQRKEQKGQIVSSGSRVRRKKQNRRVETELTSPCEPTQVSTATRR